MKTFIEKCLTDQLLQAAVKGCDLDHINVYHYVQDCLWLLIDTVSYRDGTHHPIKSPRTMWLSYLANWCFESTQPLRIRLGLKTNFSPSVSRSALESPENVKHLRQRTKARRTNIKIRWPLFDASYHVILQPPPNSPNPPPPTRFMAYSTDTDTRTQTIGILLRQYKGRWCQFRG